MVSSGNPLPTAVQFDASTPSPNQPQSATEYERFEGMLVAIAAGTVTGPTDQFGDAKIVAKASRTFREPGIEYPGASGLPVWDGNPEVFEIDPDRMGLTNLDLLAGTAFTASGCLGYAFGDYQLWPTVLTLTSVPTLPDPVRAKQPGEGTIGTLNMLRLLVNDPDPTSYQNHLVKLSQFVREVMLAPDILAVQEVGDITALQDLATQIQTDDAGIVYTAYLLEGNDVGGIDVGYLVRSTVTVNSVYQLGKNEIFTFDGSLLHDRPPLVLEGEFAPGKPIIVMNVHIRSMNNIDDPVDGNRVRLKRQAQATSISKMVQDFQNADPDVNLVVLGDFNAFEFTDGYVDVLGQIKGTPADASQAMIPGTDEVDPDLTDQMLSLAATDRYSFVHRGNAQDLDHILTSQALAPAVAGIDHALGNADAAVSYETNTATALRSSDHDGVVLYLNLDYVVPVELVSFTARVAEAGVLLSWSTASETENLGFEIYRSTQEAGDYAKATPEMIPGAGTSAEQHDYQWLDADIEAGKTYYYKLADIDFDGNRTFHGPVSAACEPLPEDFQLSQNFPNPFNPRTVIRYQLPEASDVKLVIYNTAGQLVRTLATGKMAAGKYSVTWDATDDRGARVASGVYLYRLQAGDYVSQKKLLLMK